MNYELGTQVFRKLEFLYKNKIPVHFSLVRGGWKNGDILDLSEHKLTVVIKEFKEGILPFLCEEIDFNSIEEYRRKE